MDEAIKSIEKTLGISAAIVTIAVFAGLGLMAYRNYFEIKLTQLQIKQLESQGF